MTIEQMRKRKRELGYSYQKIAQLSGLPVGTVQKVLGGITKSPREETIWALEAVLKPVFFGQEDLSSREKTPWDQGADITDHPYGREGRDRSDRIGEPSTVYSSPAYPFTVHDARDKRGKQQGQYTVEDYYDLPEDMRVELIDGIFYDIASPTPAHQFMIVMMVTQFSAFIKSKRGRCIPMIAPLDVQLDCDDRTMVQPDLFVVCDHDKIRAKVVYGAPDLVVEVLSPATRRKDMSIKLAKYTEAGVREYWMVDPDRKKILVYPLEQEELPRIYGFQDRVPVGIFEGELCMDFNEIEECFMEM